MQPSVIPEKINETNFQKCLKEEKTMLVSYFIFSTSVYCYLKRKKQLSGYPVTTERSDRNIRKHSVISGNRYYCGAGTEYDLPYHLQNVFCLMYISNKQPTTFMLSSQRYFSLSESNQTNGSISLSFKH